MDISRLSLFLPDVILDCFDITDYERTVSYLKTYDKRLTVFSTEKKIVSKQYKERRSDVKDWKQKDHATDYLIYPKNIGSKLSLDETALSNGELYTSLQTKSKRVREEALLQ